MPHKLLFERLHCVRAKWYTIGTYLDVPPGDLNAIALKPDEDCNMYLGKVLCNWEKTKDDITWEDVIEMLISPCMKEVHLAKEIKQEFKVCVHLGS